MRRLATALVFACSAAQAGISDIVQSIPPGTWYELPDTRMDAVFPSREGHPAWGVEGPSAIVSAWGGAAFDIKRNALVVTGGGHTAYGGNEVYEFRLEDLRWHRVTEPSSYESNPAYAEDAHPGNYVRTHDGAPISSHTYDGLQYLPGLGRVFFFGGSQWRAGNNYDWHAYLLDPVTQTWVRKAEAPTYSLTPASAWDSKRQRVLVTTKTGVMAYDPAMDAWEHVAGGWYSQVDRVAAYDPVHDRLLLIGPESNKKPIAYLDLGKKTDLVAPDLTGDAVPLWRPGLVYDSERKVFVAWGGNRSVWTIDPATWVATKFANSQGPAPSSKTADGKDKNRGTYSRWQYVPDYDVFIGYNSAHDNVWLYKLPGATHIPPQPPIVEQPTECGADLCVGPGWAYAQPSAAAKVAKEGDTVYIAAGNYTDCTVWPVSVTIKGVGGRPSIGGTVCEGKAIWITRGARTEIENVTLAGALGGVSNAAAIRHEGQSLILRNAEITDNHNGILVGHEPDMTVEVYDSVFHHMHTVGDLAHNIYVGRIARLVVEGNRFYDGESGHFIKSLAAQTRIAYNRIIQKKDLNAAQIDLWGCQDFAVVGNAMMRTGRYGALAFIQLTYRSDGNGQVIPCPETRNPRGLVAYNTVFFNNDLHDDPRWSNLLHYNYPTPNVLVANNLVVHTAEIVSDSRGFAEHGGRLIANEYIRAWDGAVFADYSAGDLRPARELSGAAPIEFVPTRQIAYPVGTQDRAATANVGAFEFGAGTEPGGDAGTVEPPPVSPGVLEPGSYTLQPGVYELTVE